MANSKQEAFMQAYQNCHEAFLKYCTAMSYGKMDTEDLVQDVLLSAYNHFDKIEKKDQLLHYLIRAAKNRSVSRWRKTKYKAEILDKHAEQLTSKGVSPEVLVDIDLMYRSLDKLPAKQRDALILFEVTGFSMKEIAEIQGSTEGAVKTKISRGRVKLREIMGDAPDTGATPSIFKNIQCITL